jgi:hypothetical protein
MRDTVLEVAGFAENLADLCEEVMYLRRRVRELEEYESKYHLLLNNSIIHNETMMGHTLQALLRRKE